jgi:hypothetical protein
VAVRFRSSGVSGRTLLSPKAMTLLRLPSPVGAAMCPTPCLLVLVMTKPYYGGHYKNPSVVASRRLLGKAATSQLFPTRTECRLAGAPACCRLGPRALFADSRTPDIEPYKDRIFAHFSALWPAGGGDPNLSAFLHAGLTSGIWQRRKTRAVSRLTQPGRPAGHQRSVSFANPGWTPRSHRLRDHLGAVCPDRQNG